MEVIEKFNIYRSEFSGIFFSEIFFRRIFDKATFDKNILEYFLRSGGRNRQKVVTELFF